jgi:putative FmdB family regulatory protein
MPTYEYACPSCGHQWEEFQRITENPTEDCPSCKKKTAQRQISGGNFILKGGGWYADLYSSTPSSKSKDGETKTTTKSETKTEKSETKTESKPTGGDGGSSGSSSSARAA